MKKALQSVALVLAVLLTVQPAFAAMTCTQSICGAVNSSADCCPHSSGGTMRGMSGDSTMHSESSSWGTSSNPAVAASHCASEPCCIVSGRGTAQLAAPAKFSVNPPAPSGLLGANSSVTAPNKVYVASGNAVALAPAKYILFQVFKV